MVLRDVVVVILRRVRRPGLQNTDMNIGMALSLS